VAGRRRGASVIGRWGLTLNRELRSPVIPPAADSRNEDVPRVVELGDGGPGVMVRQARA
jgi:hypothetical protein